jgi:hypothetical protein
VLVRAASRQVNLAVPGVVPLISSYPHPPVAVGHSVPRSAKGVSSHPPLRATGQRRRQDQHQLAQSFIALPADAALPASAAGGVVFWGKTQEDVEVRPAEALSGCEKIVPFLVPAKGPRGRRRGPQDVEDSILSEVCSGLRTADLPRVSTDVRNWTMPLKKSGLK